MVADFAADQIQRVVIGFNLDQARDGVELIRVFVSLASQGICVLLYASQLPADLIHLVLQPETGHNTGNLSALANR